MHREQGFTLVELLVVMAITGILAATSVKTYSVLRRSGYDTHALHMIKDTEQAIEAGLIRSTGDPAFHSVWSEPTGALNGSDVEEFVPGLQLHPQTKLYAYYNGFCEAGGGVCLGSGPCCILEWIEAAHCNGSTTKVKARWDNGQLWEMEWPNPGC